MREVAAEDAKQQRLLSKLGGNGGEKHKAEEMKSGDFPSAPFDDVDEGGGAKSEAENEKGLMWRVGLVVEGGGQAEADEDPPASPRAARAGTGLGPRPSWSRSASLVCAAGRPLWTVRIDRAVPVPPCPFLGPEGAVAVLRRSRWGLLFRSELCSCTPTPSFLLPPSSFLISHSSFSLPPSSQSHKHAI